MKQLQKKYRKKNNMKEYILDTTPLHGIVIEGQEIHPNIIAPLIPVTTMCFMGISGNSMQSKIYEHFFPDTNFLDVKTKSLYFVTQLISSVYATNKDLTYIYRIKFEEKFNGVQGIFIGS